MMMDNLQTRTIPAVLEVTSNRMTKSVVRGSCSGGSQPLKEVVGTCKLMNGSGGHALMHLCSVYDQARPDQSNDD